MVGVELPEYLRSPNRDCIVSVDRVVTPTSLTRLSWGVLKVGVGRVVEEIPWEDPCLPLLPHCPFLEFYSGGS